MNESSKSVTEEASGRATHRIAPTNGLRGTGSQLIIDSFTWLVTIPVAGLLRMDFAANEVVWLPLVALAAGMAFGQSFTGWALGLYRGRFSYGSFEEVRAVGYSSTILAVLVAVLMLAVGPLLSIPRSIVPIAYPIAIIAMLGSRYIKRLFIERSKRPDGATPTLIYGAGFLGEHLARRMITDPDSPFLPVGFLDDDPTKQSLRVRDIPVLGSFSDLKSVVARTNAEQLVVAIAKADTTLLSQVDAIARPLGLEVKVSPLLTDMLKGPGSLENLRNIEIEDLISRKSIDTDVAKIADYLSGKKVLITGAGGSIGSELARQITRFGPSELMMLDRDETGLQEIQISIDGNGLLHNNRVVLADIRDAERLKQVFIERSPDVIFHAAALKHLPLLEQYPHEAWHTNVIGTLNVLRAAEAAGVKTFVNISTDKAADPTSVLGHSKRVAEKLTAWMAEQHKGVARYVSVRFGNVIGSRGSMLPTFTKLIEEGGPLTVTHPEVTRFFMTIPEACQLVMQAGGIGRAGEVLILDMGEPVKILDIAEKMIELSGKNIDIVFTGLREGEKLHEVLIGNKEADERPFHPLITHAQINVLAPASLDRAGWEARLHNDRASEVSEASKM